MQHLSRERIYDLLHGSGTGEGPAEAVSHLAVCLSCLAEAQRLLGRGDKRKGAAKVIRDLLDLEEQSVVESILADAQWSELQRLGSKAQKDRIAVATACKTIAFARLLLGELRNSPSWEEAERIASLIAASIHAMDPIEFDDAMRNDLRGETMIELANSRRRATEWKRSEEALSKASGFLSRGSGDRRLLARLYAISASLEADRGNIESALIGFNQCKELYAEIGARDLVARASDTASRHSV